MKGVLVITFLLFSLLLNAQLKIGDKAPDFSLQTTSNTLVKLSDYKNKKLVLIDFWASWCGPCRKNNPKLVKLYEKFKDKGFEIIGVSIDESKKDWKNAILKDKLSWVQVIDPKGWEAPTARAYFVEAIPSSFLVDEDGVIQGIDLEGEDLEKKIEALLK